MWIDTINDTNPGKTGWYDTKCLPSVFDNNKSLYHDLVYYDAEKGEWDCPEHAPVVEWWYEESTII